MLTYNLPGNVFESHPFVRPRLQNLVRNPLVHVTQNLRQRPRDEGVASLQRHRVARIRHRLGAIGGGDSQQSPAYFGRCYSCPHCQRPVCQHEASAKERRRHSHGRRWWCAIGRGHQHSFHYINGAASISLDLFRNNEDNYGDRSADFSQSLLRLRLVRLRVGLGFFSFGVVIVVIACTPKIGTPYLWVGEKKVEGSED